MALNELNKDAISFKKLQYKAHTQQTFEFTEESIATNIQLAFSTIFAEEINPNPESNGGLITTGATDNIVEKVRFEIDIIPDTEIGLSQSQGYQLKLPAGYSGPLSSEFSGGTYLHTALGKLQIVPSLYGELKGDGSTEYTPVLYQTDGSTVIPQFDPINWIVDTYNGILFVQDPPSNFDNSALRPGFLEAFLYVGEYLDVRLSGITGGTGGVSEQVFTGYTATTETRLQGIESDITFISGETSGKQDQLSTGEGISPSQLAANIIEVDLTDYNAPGDVDITITGSSIARFNDQRSITTGIEYFNVNTNDLTNDSLVPKIYVDAVATGLDVKDAVNIASTPADGNLDLTGGTFSGSLDGIAVQDGWRALIKDQTDATENGIYDYTLSANTFTRSSDFDQDAEVTSGSFTSVISGNTNSATIWVVSSPDPIIVNVDDINWSFLAAPIFYNAGVGITISGNTIALDGAAIAGQHLSWSGTQLDVDLTASNVGDGEGIFRDKTGDTINLKSITGVAGITVIDSGDTIIFSGNTGATNVIGPAEDGTYTDGLFTDFTPDTPTGTAVDRFNEVLKELSPELAPDLDDIDSTGTFVSGNLSFGVTRNDIGYVNVGTEAGNSAVDFNEQYAISGTRKGITQLTVDSVLNEDVVGNPSGIPYEDNAFGNGDQGTIVLELNGSIIESIDLSVSTGATGGTYFTLSAVKFGKFDNGNDFTISKYRTGTVTILPAQMNDGFNYIQVKHTGSTFSATTNYTEWVYDPNSDAIALTGTSTFDTISMSGSKFISGVQYNTGGNVDYNVTLLNAYKNVYSDSANAITLVARENLADLTNLGISGSGLVSRAVSTLKTMTLLDSGVTNAQNTDMILKATLPINTNVLLGTLGTLGRVRSAVNVLHPFTSKSFSGASATETGFLVYNITQSNDDENEDFTGEIDRLEARDYTSLTYANINGGVYQWNSNENLITGNTQHDTGLLVFNGELIYPNAVYLTTQYGITLGDFSSIANAPAGAPDYTTASGIRDYYRKYQSNNTVIQSTLTFEIEHTGSAGDFITSGGTGGTASGDNIKFEFLIKRAGGQTHGWANPFASSGNPEGIANLSTNQVGDTMTVSCTLSTVPRVDNTDIVIVRVFAASGYTNRISNISITNI